jgi:hypothetical protein
MAAPATVNLDVYRGDTWSQTFRLQQDGAPLDLTAATVACWIIDANNTVIHLAATITSPTNGEITIAPGADPVPAAQYNYDLEITQGTEIRTWVKGQLTVRQDITNP